MEEKQKHLFILAIAYAAKYSDKGSEWGILVNPDLEDPENDRMIRIGKSSKTSKPDATPAAAIATRIEDDVPQYNLYLTYIPTEMCLGLAWRAKIKRVIYVGSRNKVIKYNPENGSLGDEKAKEELGDIYDPIGIFSNERFSSFFNNAENIAFNFYQEQIKRDVKIHYAPAAEKFRKALRKKLLHPDEGRVFFPNDLLSKGLRGVAEPASLGKDSTNLRDDSFMKIAYALVGSAWNEKVKNSPKSKDQSQPRPFGNNIGSIMVDGKTNRIIAWGLNMKHINPTYHGETLMIQEYLKRTNRKTLPESYRIYTTLEPCHMCSGYIATVGQNIKVISGQDDPNIKNSALRRRVNGCQLQTITLHDPEFLNDMLKVAITQDTTQKYGIINFLFDSGARAYYEEAAKRPTLEVVKMGLNQEPYNQEVGAVLQEGIDLLEALRREGTLSEVEW